MRRKLVGAAAIGLLIAAAAARSAESPLNAPGDKKVTVGTEILRGAREVLERSREHGSLNLASLDEEMAIVIARNSAANTDSNGFLLGARYMQVFVLNMALRHKHAAANNYLGEMGPADAKIRRYTKDIRALQRTLELDDDALASALGLQNSTRGELKDLLAEYSGTKPTPTPAPAPPPLPEFSPLPPTEFVKLIKDFVLMDSKGRPVRALPAGKRLRVISRDQNGVTIDSVGEKFVIPAAITEPSK